MSIESTPVGAASTAGITAVDAPPTGEGLRHASSLKGLPIRNFAGDTLGEVEEIVLDVPRGVVAYVVMASGGFLGIGEKLFAIPWGVLQHDAAEGFFRLDADKSLFDKAPGFERNHWPTQLNGGEDWHRDVHAFYGTQTYWERS